MSSNSFTLVHTACVYIHVMCIHSCKHRFTQFFYTHTQFLSLSHSPTHTLTHEHTNSSVSHPHSPLYLPGRMTATVDGSAVQYNILTPSSLPSTSTTFHTQLHTTHQSPQHTSNLSPPAHTMYGSLFIYLNFCQYVLEWLSIRTPLS